MNVKDYIASGIIESYVMGLAGESERIEFEHYCTQYPELAAERSKFEERLEQYALGQAAAPPPDLGAKVMAAIGNQPVITPASSIPAKSIFLENSSSPVQPSKWLRLVAAAAVMLLIGMVALYYRVSQQNKELAGTNRDLASTNERFKAKLDTTQRILDGIIQETEVLSNPNAMVVNMIGTKSAPKSSANIYWDSTNTSVYLVVRNMPKLPSDQQYQLWALIDNHPRDLGVFDATNDRVILKMKNTRKAQAFAITIEQKGGSPSPNLQKMQSLGKTVLTQ